MKLLLIKLLRKIAFTSYRIDNAINDTCFNLACKLDDNMIIARDYNIED